MLYKSIKINYTVVKSSWVISHFNYLGKVGEKVATETLADLCYVHYILYDG